MRSEADFVRAIDCRFPYGDVAAATALVDEAGAISPNAVFHVAYELVTPPRGAHADVATRLALL